MPTCRAGRGLPRARLEVKTHSDMMGVHALAQECTDAGGRGGDLRPLLGKWGYCATPTPVSSGGGTQAAPPPDLYILSWGQRGGGQPVCSSTF